MKSRMLELIESNIREYGHHIYFISGGQSPRYAYTIGLTESLGTELIIAGATFYSKDEIRDILNGIAKVIQHSFAMQHSKIDLGSLGRFTLGKIDSSWIKSLLLGAIDYYGTRQITALQVFPNRKHWTVDIPNFSHRASENSEPVWRWIHKPWDFNVPENSIAITNVEALQRERITEVTRWEKNEWELFAGNGPEVPKEKVRIVPLGTMLASDPTLHVITELDIGSGLWRDVSELAWNEWV